MTSKHANLRVPSIIIFGSMRPLTTCLKLGSDEYVRNVIFSKVLSVGILLSFISSASETKILQDGNNFEIGQLLLNICIKMNSN